MSAKGKRKRPQEKSDLFAFFKQAATDTCEPLVTDFGFKQEGVVEYMPDCVIKYWNRTTGVDVRYEWKSQVAVNLSKLERTRTEVEEGRSYDLLLLLELRRPEIDVDEFYGADKDWSNEFIYELLRKYVQYLRETAQDVLSGDFSVFPELRRLSAHHRRQSNKELFGTYVGESPRFSVRPSLEQVFAGAKDIDPELERLFGGKLNQDKTQGRIYEAYWDHQYSVSEIADFLDQTEDAIEQELEDYDDRY